MKKTKKKKEKIDVYYSDNLNLIGLVLKDGIRGGIIKIYINGEWCFYYDFNFKYIGGFQ